MAKKGKTKITAKQKAARRKNMAIARAARSRYSKAERVLRQVGAKREVLGSGKFFLEASKAGKSRHGGQKYYTMGHTRRITSGLKKAGVKFKRKGQLIHVL